jgi:hypothetical protein
LDTAKCASTSQLHIVLLCEAVRYRQSRLAPRFRDGLQGLVIAGDEARVLLARLGVRRARQRADIMLAMAPPKTPRTHRVLKGLTVLAVVAMAFLAGMLVERLRLDAQREDMLRRYDRVLRQYREDQMISEKAIRR